MKYLYLILILSISLLHCDEVQNKTNYNIDELINFTINSHPSIKASKQALIASKAGVKSAMWNYFPTPKISAQQTKDNVNGITLSLEQPLWTGGKLSSAMDMAKANRTDSEAALEENAYNLVESLLNALRTHKTAQGNRALHKYNESNRIQHNRKQGDRVQHACYQRTKKKAQ